MVANRFCVDCKYHKLDLKGHQCTKVEDNLRSLVTGQYPSISIACDRSRRDENLCGRSGEYWEPSEQAVHQHRLNTIAEDQMRGDPDCLWMPAAIGVIVIIALLCMYAGDAYYG